MKIKEVQEQVKIHEWMHLIRERNDSGMTIESWCEMKGLSKHQYYYWLRRIRQSACNAIEAHTEERPRLQDRKFPDFAQINIPLESSTPPSSGIYIRTRNADIYIGNDVHPEQLITVMQVIAHAK